MGAYKVSAVVERDGTITTGDLPFCKGDRLKVVLPRQTGGSERDEAYPLKGEPIRYDDPFGNAAEDEWKLVD